MFNFTETSTDTEALKISREDPNTPFPEIWIPADDVGQTLLIIRFKGSVVGFALIASFFGNIEIHRFFIRPDRRCAGFGTAAATALVKYLRKALGGSIDIEAIDGRSERMWRRALADIPHYDHGQGKLSAYWDPYKTDSDL